MKTIIVIPLYNHAATVRSVAEQCLAINTEVLVVDDGSQDNGANNLDGLPLTLLQHTKNLGKGAAIMTAAAEAGRRGATHIVTLDADGQHDPADIPALLARQ